MLHEFAFALAVQDLGVVGALAGDLMLARFIGFIAGTRCTLIADAVG